MKKSDENAQVLLGRRIRSLRHLRRWTQEQLGEKADVNYKFVGEIERGQQNPSFAVLVKIAGALGIELPEFFRFEMEALSRREVEEKIVGIVKSLPNQDLGRMLSLLRECYPVK
mgnify:CR=1 FL=1